MRGMAIFAAVALLAIAFAGGLLALVFRAPGSGRAIAISAALAWGVQLVSYAIVRLAGPSKVMAAWGLGAILRLGMLLLYAFIGVRALALPAAPALLSLATFLFLSTVIESRLLSV